MMPFFFQKLNVYHVLICKFQPWSFKWKFWVMTWRNDFHCFERPLLKRIPRNLSKSRFLSIIVKKCKSFHVSLFNNVSLSWMCSFVVLKSKFQSKKDTPTFISKTFFEKWIFKLIQKSSKNCINPTCFQVLLFIKKLWHLPLSFPWTKNFDKMFYLPLI